MSPQASNPSIRHMRPRAQELHHFRDSITWLSQPEAEQAYRLASKHDSGTHYGLDVATTSEIERLVFKDSTAVAAAWLEKRLPPNEIVVVTFGPHDSFECTSTFFAENWPNIFCPSRDDAIVRAVRTSFVLFYYHENEFEVGKRVA
jgi:hypothetical protein